MLSPRPGVIPEGHCQPGTGPTPRTSQRERTLATQGYPWDSRRLYLKFSDTGKTEYSNTQQGLPEFGYTLARNETHEGIARVLGYF
jgi:hypothetical protein